MELLQIEELTFVYRCQACRSIGFLQRREYPQASRYSNCDRQYLIPLTNPKSLALCTHCASFPDENIDDLETQLWSSLRLQIKPEKTPVDLVVTPILSFIMLIMMYLPTDGRNISGTDLSAPDVSLYTTLVALFRLPGVFSLALFFFLMSAVEQRIAGSTSPDSRASLGFLPWSSG